MFIAIYIYKPRPGWEDYWKSKTKVKRCAWCYDIKYTKRNFYITSYPLSIIINQYLYTGTFPSKLKISNVIPLFRNDDNRFFGKYRTITLLSSVSNILARIASNQLYNYFLSNDLSFDCQYGLQKETLHKKIGWFWSRSLFLQYNWR